MGAEDRAESGRLAGRVGRAIFRGALRRNDVQERQSRKAAALDRLRQGLLLRADVQSLAGWPAGHHDRVDEQLGVRECRPHQAVEGADDGAARSLAEDLPRRNPVGAAAGAGIEAIAGQAIHRLRSKKRAWADAGVHFRHRGGTGVGGWLQSIVGRNVVHRYRIRSARGPDLRGSNAFRQCRV